MGIGHNGDFGLNGWYWINPGTRLGCQKDIGILHIPEDMG